jgi:hypothetical protein
MTKENDAHSGANPEPTADLETDTSLAPAIDNTTDDDATREIIRPETISAPASEPDGDEDDECDEYIDPGYTVVYDRIKDACVHVPKNAEPADAVPADAAAATESKPLAPVPVVPTGTLPLLEAQLGEALKIMRDFATWVNSPRAPIEKCIAVADSVGQLARASAQLGKVAVRLQNGDPESRHRVIVEYAEPQGGGVRQTRKRLNHGRG